MSEKEYYAFISYNREDEGWAIWLQHELDKYHLPEKLVGIDGVRQSLRPVFRDIDELSAGNLPKQIQNALENSQNLIVVCSPNSASSEWVNKEIMTFVSLGKTDRIFPFIVEGGSPKDYYPPAILELPESKERYGGNVHESGKNAAFVKIVAGMLGLGFDTLWQRYEREKEEEEHKLREQRNDLLHIQSQYVAEIAGKIIEGGNSYLARRLLLEVLPKDLNNPNRPYTPEAESFLRKAILNDCAIIADHKSSVIGLDVSPDGKRIVSSSWDGTIRIWDSRTGKQLGDSIVVGDINRPFPVSFSPDGKYIMSASDGIIRIWDAETNNLIKKLSPPICIIMSAAYSPDGKWIVTGSSDGLICILDSQTGEQVSDTIKVNTYPVCSVSFSPDGTQILSSSYDSTARIWDVNTGKQNHRLKKWFSGAVDSAVFSPDGRRVATATSDGVIRIWDALSGKRIFRPLVGHTDGVESIMFSAGGDFIVSASLDRTVRFWDVVTGKQILKFIGHADIVTSVKIISDGRIVSASDDGTIRIWNVLRDWQEYALLEGHKSNVKTASFSHDGEMLVSASYDQTIRIWDAKTCKQIGSPLVGHTKIVTSAEFSPDGKKIVSSSCDGTIRLWDVSTGSSFVIQNRDNTDSVNSAYFSPDGKRIVSTSRNVIRVWDATTGELLISLLEGHTDEVLSASFSPDCRQIISGSYDGSIRIWDSLTGEPLDVIQFGQNVYISRALFSPDMRLIAFISGDNRFDTVNIWNIEKRMHECAPIRIRDVAFLSVSFSPDGKYIVTSSEDKTIRIWDSHWGCPIGSPLTGHSGDVNSARFNSKGNQIVSASDDETIRIWKFAPLDELIQKTRERFNDYPLTLEEKKRYYLG